VARYTAIAAVSMAILGLLEDANQEAAFANAEFELLQVTDFQKTKPVEEGISLYLYRVTFSEIQRNLRQPRGNPEGRFRPSLPLDLHYLITAWAASGAQQQRLLGWCLRVLEDTPEIPAAVINHYDLPDKNAFKEGESVALTFNPLSIQDMTNVLDPLKPNAHVSVPYLARIVYLDSDVERPQAGEVQTREFQFGRMRSS
jgi:hypothetical protein